MRDYELVVLYHPDLEMDLEKPLKKIEGLIKDVGGKITFSDNWGKRKLAYQIVKQDYAVYVYYELQLSDEAVAKLESMFNITDEVIRYLVTKPSPTFGDRDAKSQVDEEEDNKERDSKKDAKESKQDKE